MGNNQRCVYQLSRRRTIYERVISERSVIEVLDSAAISDPEGIVKTIEEKQISEDRKRTDIIKTLREKLKQGGGDDIILDDEQLLRCVGHFARLAPDKLERSDASKIVTTVKRHIEVLYRPRPPRSRT